MIDFNKYYEKKELDNGMNRVYRHPHVTDIAHLESACEACSTGAYYFVSRYLGRDIDGITILTELSKLQDTNPESETYGCMKWYRESWRIQDTNSAFFTLRYLCYALKFCPQNIPAQDREIMLPMLRCAVNWFKHECKKGGFFYPNKIMSDGAMLLLLCDLLKDEALIDDALEFWTGWIDYTKEYGWGWGENASKNYTRVMKDALIVALMCMEKNSNIYKELISIYKKMLDYCAYHGEYEFVPSIRTYNYTGEAVFGDNAADSNPLSDKILNDEKIAAEILHQNAPKIEITPDKSDFHVERIFGDSYASTYKGENIRLGTVSKFPVMCNCYGLDGWGLGWQSMPVSALAVKHEVSFMRFVTISGGEFKSHMATGLRDKTLFPDDENVPDVFTYSAQKGNKAVVVRMLKHLANNTSYLSDEWYFQHFSGEIRNIGGWYVFDYGDCALCIKLFDGDLELKRDDEKIRLINKFYEGEEKLVIRDKLVSSWAVVALDNSNNIEFELSKINASKEDIYDPRYSRTISPFEITCGEASFVFDPDKTYLI